MTSPNIIIKGSSKELFKGHQITTDGKDNSAEETRLLKEKEIEYLEYQYTKLRARDVKCDVREAPGRKPCIVGTFKNEPFLVYMQKMSRGKEWCFLTTTRYKGESVDMVPPLEVLK